MRAGQVGSVETVHSMNCLSRHPAGEGLVETESLARPQPVLHPDLLVTKQGVETAAGRPPAEARPGEGEVGDELLGGGEPRHQDLLLTAGLGTALVPGYEAVHLADSYEERGGDEGDVLGEDPTGGLLTAVLRPVLLHVLPAGVVWVSGPELRHGALVVILSPAASQSATPAQRST